MNFNNFKIDAAMAWNLCFVFCLAISFILLPDFATADVAPANNASGTNSSGIADVVCKIVGELQGPLGRGVGMIAVIVLGIGLFLGKLSWALAVATAIGIGLIFSAGKVVNWLGGKSEQCL